MLFLQTEASLSSCFLWAGGVWCSSNAPWAPHVFAGTLWTLQVKKQTNRQLGAEKHPTSFASLSYCSTGWIKTRSFCGCDDKIYSCLEKTETVVEKLVLAASGYLELYDSTNRNYYDLCKKQQVWRHMSAAHEISGKLFFSIVVKRTSLLFLPHTQKNRAVLQVAKRALPDWALRCTFEERTTVCWGKTVQNLHVMSVLSADASIFYVQFNSGKIIIFLNSN